MPSPEPSTVFDAVGEAGLRRLVSAFYRRVPGDDVLGPMYPADDLAEAERRLGDFLIYRFGGPDTYIRERGNPQLRMRHIQFAITSTARDRWVSLMDAALDEAALPFEVAAVMKPFLHEAATFLVNRP
ncbi:MAG: globin [Candidatus Saccharimonas sp.]|nr:globin [Planctomycetaceae bacterium]